MNVGSLFSGIGGIDLGLERAGMRIVWQCESDPYARAVLARRFPSATLHADVREAGRASLAPVELICGGFPCQDISAAGRGAGLAGARSGLWFQFARILGELRPRLALIECTPPWKRWLPVVRGQLYELRYASVPIQLSAADFGAPHLRRRIFVVAHADGSDVRDKLGRGSWPHREAPAFAANDGEQGIVADTEGECGKLRPAEGERPRRSSGGGLALAESDRVALERPSEPWQERNPWGVEPDVGRVADGVPARVDRLRCIGNAVVPQIAEYIGRLILAHAGDAMTIQGRAEGPLKAVSAANSEAR